MSPGNNRYVKFGSKSGRLMVSEGDACKGRQLKITPQALVIYSAGTGYIKLFGISEWYHFGTLCSILHSQQELPEKSNEGIPD